ncbi:aminotransferase class III-fold pyridoxal phosphate-dependent enzyme [Roseibacillus ishigakijimensis]|uniref:Adenosylmethionine-8-amino-7-oxononanoate aminotransferase n=1 Tax=Roseibacillus ishigakijimensis TaxID=454146 RepID=A0A934RS92_9BACT|nr:aminotransferase class III-fold pyridoxal phosphate-dependent enzyme [Roseibacillus ishigakijimensis]MBK1834716.1 aminotransferase class III-fold pyridoxal phosphate-dependent enzyme [Roseibacillus ishigakijimensis]
MTSETQRWLQADWAHAWHPFTDHALWEGEVGPVIVRGEGVYLEDSEGRRYFDANSSIWTNIHGHSHPRLVAALQEQAATLCHSSYLGLANARASELSARLCEVADLDRCFFSDNGSTAIEAALRMELQWRHLRGEKERRGFVAFENAYHGDTLGAASLGGVGRFFTSIAGLGPQVSWARDLTDLEHLDPSKIAAVVIEPLIQGVNQMRPWPTGLLRELRAWCDAHGVHLILDEVMTGFGRTGELFACQREAVRPDYLCLAKAITGGTMPLAATLTTGEIYEEFKGPGKTFYYGHSYTANPLGCAVALASLALCLEPGFLPGVRKKARQMEGILADLAARPGVHEVRQCGLVAGIELASEGGGAEGRRLCQLLRGRGLLTRPILDTLVWMPPLASTAGEIARMGALFAEVLGGD